jgi:ADP-ribose pyrophosphatase
MIKKWKRAASRISGDYRVFSVRTDTKISPRTGEPHDFYVLETVDWVNVIALTPDDHLILVEQYRHGSDTIELEIPGGMMDQDESAVLTGVRELREETGYSGENARVLGEILPNPAIMNNRCFTVLVENCRCVHPTQFDHSEELITRLVPVKEIPFLVASGKIRHSLVVVALFHFVLSRKEILC